jgi:predicted Zn-dependent protease
MLGSLANEGLQTGAALYLQSYSRDQEREADRLGIRYMARANYDPEAMVSFFRKLDGFGRLESSMVGDPAAADRFNIMASHPRTSERVREAGVEAAKARRTGQRLEQQRYLLAIEGLLYGDAPEQGFRRGRDFLHPGLRIGFRVPKGFVLRNAPQQVVAIGPDGALIVFDAEPRADVARAVPDMETYLTRVWAAKARLAALQQFTLDGMPAAAAAARAQTRSGVVDVRLVAIRGAPERIWRFAFVSAPQATDRMLDGFQATAQSFRNLSAEEAAALKPWRIRLATVEEGDTQEALAARMAMPDFRLETFRVLNGLSPGDALVPGETVKIVAE